MPVATGTSEMFDHEWAALHPYEEWDPVVADPQEKPDHQGGGGHSHDGTGDEATILHHSGATAGTASGRAAMAWGSTGVEASAALTLAIGGEDPDAPGSPNKATAAGAMAVGPAGAGLLASGQLAGVIGTSLGLASGAGAGVIDFVGGGTAAGANSMVFQDGSTGATHSNAFAFSSAATAANQMRFGAKHVEMVEITDPGNGAANSARLYARDNGAGKTQLVVVFGSGAVQVLATEP